MKVLIIGVTGQAGSRITTEARQRGHHVSAASRRTTTSTSDAPTITLDAADAAQVAAAASDHDVIVAATRPAPGNEDAVAATTAGLAEGARRAGARLLVVGGAAALLAPGTDRSVLDDPAWIPPAIRDVAAASSRQLEVLIETAEVDWTYLAPAATFEPGPRTGTYRTGGPELVVDATGTSRVSMENYAIAVLDEIKTPTTTRAVFSIGS